MASKFYLNGKKLKGLNVYTDVDPTSAITAVYGETTFTENIPKQKRLALMRIEADSKSGTYTATFGQPVEDVVNVINQLSTWVGDVEKAATASTATQGVSTGTTDIFSQTYLGWVKVGGSDKYVSILGNQGGIKATGDITIGGSLYSNGQKITGLHPVCRMKATGLVDTNKINWSAIGYKCYIKSQLTYDSTKGEFTVVAAGHYLISLNINRSTATSSSYAVLVNGNYVEEHFITSGRDSIDIMGLYMEKGDVLRVDVGSGTVAADWSNFSDCYLNIMVVPDSN